MKSDQLYVVQEYLQICSNNTFEKISPNKIKKKIIKSDLLILNKTTELNTIEDYLFKITNLKVNIFFYLI